MSGNDGDGGWRERGEREGVHALKTEMIEMVMMMMMTTTIMIMTDSVGGNWNACYVQKTFPESYSLQ